MPVPQPAKVADWLYIGALHDIQMLVAEGPRALSFEGILSLCSEGMRKVEGVDSFGHLQISVARTRCWLPPTPMVLI